MLFLETQFFCWPSYFFLHRDVREARSVARDPTLTSSDRSGDACPRVREPKTFTGSSNDLRGAWSDRDTNDIFAHCSLIFHFFDFKFSNFVCPSELHPLVRFFCKNSFEKMKNIRKTTQNALAPSIFIVWSIVLKLGTPLLHTQVQNTLLQNF